MRHDVVALLGKMLHEKGRMINPGLEFPFNTRGHGLKADAEVND